jgi:hypothetical protein
VFSASGEILAAGWAGRITEASSAWLLKSSPGGEDTGEGGPKHQLILFAMTRSCRKPGHNAIRANLGLSDFLVNLAKNHGRAE